MNKKLRRTSRAFMRFAHSLPCECAICRWTKGERVPAVELHHYGEKGMGQRGDDWYVAPLCLPCHHYYQGKRWLSFMTAGELDVMAAMQRGNLEILSAYAAQLESGDDPYEDCALAELDLWLITEAPDLSPDRQKRWLIKWANRRADNVLKFLAEPMDEIASDGSLSADDVRRVASRALKVAGYGDNDDE
jgi:hypothetical protein